MKHYPSWFALVGVALLALALGFGGAVRAQAPAAKPAAAVAPAAPQNCKAFNGGKCCDPAVAAHLPRAAIMKACGETEDTFLGENGNKDSCRYVFKAEGGKPDETFVEVYVPASKENLTAPPPDLFFKYKKVGNAYVTDKATSPKSAPMLAARTGLWVGGKGYSVSVNASAKVCTKPEALKLAPSMK